MGLVVGPGVGFSGMIPGVELSAQVLTRTHVILPEEVVAEIDQLVGQRGRSAFLAQAAREELKRRRLKKFLTSDEVVWSAKDHPELADGADSFVRSMRDDGEESDRERRGYR